jgi:curved DNA-binding protein CbpA
MPTSLPPNPYLALNVETTATLAEIRRRHRELVLKLHPDKVHNPSKKDAAVDAFQKVQQAYELLSDESKRDEYDSQVTLARLKSENQEIRSSDHFDHDLYYPQPHSEPRSKARNGRPGRPASYDNNYSAKADPADPLPSRKSHSRSYDENRNSPSRSRENVRDFSRQEEDRIRARAAAKEIKRAAYSRRTRQRDSEKRHGIEEKFTDRYVRDTGSDSDPRDASKRDPDRPPSGRHIWADAGPDFDEYWTLRDSPRTTSPLSTRNRSQRGSFSDSSDSEASGPPRDRKPRSAPATVVNPPSERERKRSTVSAAAAATAAATAKEKLRLNADLAAAYMTEKRKSSVTSVLEPDSESEPKRQPLRRADTFQDSVRYRSDAAARPGWVAEDSVDTARRSSARPLRRASTQTTESPRAMDSPRESERKPRRAKDEPYFDEPVPSRTLPVRSKTFESAAPPPPPRANTFEVTPSRGKHGKPARAATFHVMRDNAPDRTTPLRTQTLQTSSDSEDSDDESGVSRDVGDARTGARADAAKARGERRSDAREADADLVSRADDEHRTRDRTTDAKAVLENAYEVVAESRSRRGTRTERRRTDRGRSENERGGYADKASPRSAARKTRGPSLPEFIVTLGTRSLREALPGRWGERERAR